MDDFRGREISTYRDNTDLCTFVRTIFLWVPIILVINLATIVFVSYVAVEFLFLIWLHLGFAGGILLFILAIVIAAVALILSGKLLAWALFKVEDSEGAKLFVEYARAKKSLICPLISIKEVPNENS